MKLVTAKHRKDVGHDWYVQLLHTSRWALLQASVSWNDYTSWPYIQMKMGGGSLWDVLFLVGRFGFCVEFMGRKWGYERLDKLNEEYGDA